jgi:PIN domain nuclease of toxin-antitoxin system
MSSAIADTHTIIWHLHAPEKLSNTADHLITATANAGDKLYISAITIIELTYLIEKKKVEREVMEKLLNTLDDPASNIDLLYITGEVAKAVKDVPPDLVPDMPDRIIAATAMSLNLPLVTRDEKLRNFSPLTTIW